MGKFYTVADIELRASRLLADFWKFVGRAPAPPISSEEILDTILADQLSSLLWEAIEEPTDSPRLGCLDLPRRVIVLNENRRDMLEQTRGLINTTVAHEIGHWELHVDKPHPNQGMLAGLESVPVSTVERPADPWDERNAHRFMANLLMPAELLSPIAATRDLTHWQGLYRLRDQFDVTITAMKIRLQELGFNYVDRDGTFHRSRREAAGQNRMI